MFADSDSAASGAANTALGNAIGFAYSGYSAVSGGWGNLLASGYLYNTTALSGLESMSVSFGSPSGALSVSFGWWDSGTNAIVYESAGDSVTPSSPSFGFGGYGPSFFKIENDTASAIQIGSLTLAYSCSATEDSLAGAGLMTFALSDDGTSYSVTGADGSITSADIPPTHFGKPVASIGDYAFSYCYSLTSVSIPSSVTSIGDDAFQGCASLTSVSIPSSVAYIGGYAFFDCESLESVSIPSSVTSIEDDTFSYCYSLTSVSIPSSVTSIGDNVFSDCFLLSSVSIPSSVTSIGWYAFSGCSSLSSVSIPSSVAYIGEGAFLGCASLSIYCQADSQPSGWDAGWNPDGRPVAWGAQG